MSEGVHVEEQTLPGWVLGRLGERVGDRWQLVGVLGLGGVGVVYDVVDDAGTSGALKILRSDIAVSPLTRTSFVREAKIPALVVHSGIVEVLDQCSVEARELWFVMEKLESATLHDLLATLEAPLRPDHAADLAIALLDALGALHAAGFLHRDIKPANVFVGSSNQVKLADFGSVFSLGHDDDLARVGTPEYMAPEQAVHGGDALDQRADIFAVGALLYRALSGRPLRQADDIESAIVVAATAVPDSLAAVAPRVPIELVTIVDKALAYNRNDRFTSCPDMAAALKELIASGGVYADTLSDEVEHSDDGLLVALQAAQAARRANETNAASVQEQRRLLRDTFRHANGVVSAVRRSQSASAEAKKRLERLHEGMQAAIEQFHGVALVAVRPTSFLFAGAPVWEPDDTLAEITFALFSAGIRSLRFLRGLTAGELFTLCEMFALIADRDADVETAVEPLLHGDFPHIAATVVASFDVALLDRIADVEAIFGDARQEIDTAMREAENALKQTLGAGQRASVRALTRSLADGSPAVEPDSPGPDRLLPSVDSRAAVVELGSLGLETIKLAIDDAEERGDISTVVAPIRSLLDELVVIRDTDRVAKLVYAALNARSETTFGAIAERLVGERALRLLVSGAADVELPSGETLGASVILARLLCAQPNDAAQLLLELWSTNESSDAGAQIGKEIVARAGRMLPLLNDRLSSVPLSIAQQLHAATSGTRDPVAYAALRSLGRHASDDVKLASLSTRIRLGDTVEPTEVQRLLGSPNASVRTQVLAIVRESGRTGFAPMLVTYALEERLHQLPLAERQQTLVAIFTLSASHGETACIELLRPRQWVDGGSVAATRQLAAELLGSLGSSNAAREALRTEARRVLRSTGELRAVAKTALETIDHRLTSGKGGQ